jgi:uncharacterized protein
VLSANITLITLGVADVAKATAFYQSLGFVKSKTTSEESVSFLRAGGVLALWSCEAQCQGANGRMVVAQNAASEAEVDAVMATAEASGDALEAGVQVLLGRL